MDELICHISSLASVYHKPPSAFVEGRILGLRKTLPQKVETVAEAPTVIPNQESLIGDLLSMDVGSAVAPPNTGKADFLGTGLDVLVSL